MKPGDLRRFRDDAFRLGDVRFNGKLFLVLSVDFDWVDIVADGIVDDGWSQRIIEESSEPVSDTR